MADGKLDKARWAEEKRGGLVQLVPIERDGRGLAPGLGIACSCEKTHVRVEYTILHRREFSARVEVRDLCLFVLRTVTLCTVANTVLAPNSLI